MKISRFLSQKKVGQPTRFTNICFLHFSSGESTAIRPEHGRGTSRWESFHRVKRFTCAVTNEDFRGGQHNPLFILLLSSSSKTNWKVRKAEIHPKCDQKSFFTNTENHLRLESAAHAKSDIQHVKATFGRRRVALAFVGSIWHWWRETFTISRNGRSVNAVLCRIFKQTLASYNTKSCSVEMEEINSSNRISRMTRKSSKRIRQLGKFSRNYIVKLKL